MYSEPYFDDIELISEEEALSLIDMWEDEGL